MAIAVGILVWVGQTPAVAEAVAAAETSGDRLPRAAILILADSELGRLFERRLRESPRAVWLDGGEAVEAARKQQDFDRLMDPSAGPLRVAVGKQLKADLLVLQRYKEKVGRKVEVVVCETKHGVRICSEEVPVAASEKALAVALINHVGTAISRYRADSKSCWTVAPLHNANGPGQFDYLQETYAWIVRLALARQPGTIVLEPDEAAAIGQNSPQPGLAESSSFQRPLRIIGEFRHRIENGDQRVTIRLELKRGQEVLLTRTFDDLAPVDAAGRLRQTAGEFYREVTGIAAVLGKPEDEARVQLGHGDSFAVCGLWKEALQRYEASFLLGPGANWAVGEARSVAEQLMFSYHREMVKRPDDADCVADFLRYHNLAWFFGEASFRGYTTRPRQGAALFLDPLVREDGSLVLPTRVALSGELARMYAEAIRVKEDLLLKIVQREVETGADYPDVGCWILEKVGGYLCDPPGRESAAKLRAIESVQHSPLAKRYALAIARGGLRDPHGSETRQLLAALDASDVPAVQQVAAALRADIGIDEDTRDRQDPASNAPSTLDQPEMTPPRFVPTEFKSGAVVFRPVELSFGHEQNMATVTDRIDEVLPAGFGVDAVRIGRHVYLMKEAGKLQPAWEPPLSEISITQLSFDGRLIWVSTAASFNCNPRIAVIDPRTGGSLTLDVDAWLPDAPGYDVTYDGVARRYASVAPLSPGKAFLTVSYGTSWGGLIDLHGKLGMRPLFMSWSVLRVANHPRNRRLWRGVSFASEPLCTLAPNGAAHCCGAESGSRSSSGGIRLAATCPSGRHTPCSSTRNMALASPITNCRPRTLISWPSRDNGSAIPVPRKDVC